MPAPNCSPGNVLDFDAGIGGGRLKCGRRWNSGHRSAVGRWNERVDTTDKEAFAERRRALRSRCHTADAGGPGKCQSGTRRRGSHRQCVSGQGRLDQGRFGGLRGEIAGYRYESQARIRRHRCGSRRPHGHGPRGCCPRGRRDLASVGALAGARISGNPTGCGRGILQRKWSERRPGAGSGRSRHGNSDGRHQGKPPGASDQGSDRSSRRKRDHIREQF
mmetsp:Transcript_23099/g.50426  ORF Transcript_23099/g.50426 Transcript_23099/m.50426 type:complete len:219 (+) Transcript_23099:163-819(+)